MYTIEDALQSISPQSSGWEEMNFGCSQEDLKQDLQCYKTRNAGGPQYFHHLANIAGEMTKNNFMEVHKAYCAVSGSPVRVTETDNGLDSFNLTVKMNTIDGSEVCGEYHMCCTPCFCDIQRFATAEKLSMDFSDGAHEIDVLTIKDPCNNPIPQGITSFICNDDGTTENAIRIEDRIVVGVLQNTRECTSDDLDSIEQDMVSECSMRMTASKTEIARMGGMGDLFTELACNNDGCPNDLDYNR